MEYNFGMIKYLSTCQYFSKSKYQLQMVDSHLLKEKAQARSSSKKINVHIYRLYTHYMHICAFMTQKDYIFALKACPLSYPASIQYQIFTFQSFK